jgi:hypothetical protein
MQPKPPSIRARTVLVHLVRNRNWHAQDEEPFVPGLGVVNLQRFLTPVWKIAWEASAIKGTHGFWGRVIRADHTEALTLDFGRAFDVSVTLAFDLAKPLTRRARVHHASDLLGGFVLMTGELQERAAGASRLAFHRRWQINVTDPRRCAFLSREHSRHLFSH